MAQSEYWQKRLEAKEYYSSIRKVACPAFSGEEIVFNTHGFTHLIRKGGILRPEKDQIRRFLLLKYAVSILSDENIYPVYDQIGATEFWMFNKIINRRIIKVIVRKIPNGKKHFFSIMNRS